MRLRTRCSKDKKEEEATYEEIRAAKIKRNDEFLKSLGIQPKKSVQKKTTTKKKTNINKKPLKITLRRRRSSRLHQQPNEMKEPLEEPVESTQPKSYIDSSVYQYIFSNEKESTGENNNLLIDSTLKRIYSMDFGPKDCPLLAAGGHQGYVRVHATRGSCQESYMTFRAHQGWISSVSLSLRTYSDNNRLLTSSNDGLLKLWNIDRSWTSTTGQSQPQELAVADSLHSKGIFSMHVVNNNIFTASKDGSIGVSQVNEGRFKTIAKYERNDGILKCVESQLNGTIVAAVGNSGTIHILDLRAFNQPITGSLTSDSIDGGLTSIAWNPCQEAQFCVSGLEPVVELWDTRKLDKPVTIYRSCLNMHSKAIYRPVFSHDSPHLNVCFPREKALTRYELGKETTSFGKLDYQPTVCCIDRFSNSMALASSTGDIHIVKT